MLKYVLVVLVAVLMTDLAPSDAFEWPWLFHRHHHWTHHRRHEDATTPFAEPETNCQEVMEARKTLDDRHWQQQLKFLTDGQRANVDKCIRSAR